MKKISLKKSLLVFIASLAIIVAGCQRTEDNNILDIGILSIMDHNSLNDAEQGFIDGMTALGYEEGVDVTYHRMNAQGQQANLYPMAGQLLKNAELVLGIGTPTIQALAVTEEEKPLLFTAVTDPISAGLAESLSASGRNVTGTSDQMPVEKQVELLISIKPEAEKVGIIYNTGEVNSQIQAEQAKEAILAAGKTPVIRTVTSTNDVQQALNSVMSDVELLYVPTDNIMAGAASTVGAVSEQYQVPVVAGSIDQIEDGGLATYSLNYYELGRQTAEMAVRVIEGEDPSTMPIEQAKELELFVNEDMAEALGIDPDSIQVAK
ncbi:ABC transporter substrate-binding protein [Aerococcus sp. HMSC10H05]|uniref:ABC transporter substrate-binding protein n=1 Tax=Aerococcus sp. HMSC10H05 TaxID=1581084 RepID=UPI0008A3A152|nr:ABC transporter substrate-binding protein [Aerococcus sp. HMSC10H05]OFU47979.1 ABC transporter [Aerococcus sp. HMSC10H05]